MVFGRYAPGRRFAFDRKEPSLPLGYLLQLAIKHLDSPPAITSQRVPLWTAIASLAADLCAVVDVEPYLKEEHIVISANDVPRYLPTISLFDHLFALKQWPPSRAADLLRGATKKLDPNEVKSRVGWELSDVYALLDAVIRVAEKPFAIVTPKDLEQAGFPAAAWAKLEASFVHPLKTVNRAYTTPLDGDQAELDFRPLFALAQNRLLTITPGLATLGFFEATTRALRAGRYPNLESLLGDGIELIVANTLRAAGLNVSIEGVDYIDPKGQAGAIAGECDTVVETDKYVVFFELKKKPLRRLSATGDAAPGLVDLTASLYQRPLRLTRVVCLAALFLIRLVHQEAAPWLASRSPVPI